MTTSNIDWTKATVKVGVPVVHTATSDLQEIEIPLANFFLLAKWAYEQDLKKIDDALRVRSPSERYEAYNIFVTGEMENGTYNTIPHCDSRILHHPAECSYCDRPEWHRKRVELGIACTGHAPKDNEIPCEADLLRPPGGESDHRRWGGNKPTSAKGDPSWPEETAASKWMYGEPEER